MASFGLPGSGNPPSERAATGAATSPPAISNLEYPGRTGNSLSDSDPARFTSSAQSRSLDKPVPGATSNGRSRFMRRLAGPAERLRRVWRAIRQERRHTGISVLGRSIAAVRRVRSSALALALRQRSSSGHDGQGMQLPGERIDARSGRPDAWPVEVAVTAPRLDAEASRGAAPELARLSEVRATLQVIVNSRIVPALLARHAHAGKGAPVIDPCADALAHQLLLAEPGPAFALVDRACHDGRSIVQLCAGLFEPAARALGDLWQSDRCDNLQLELGLAHLLVALRRVAGEASAQNVPRLWHPRSVLVAPSPREPHLMGSVIASEIFGRAGWDVRAEFPESDVALCQLVRDQWFDVLDLSLSIAFQRNDCLPALAGSISAAHASSRNPGLIVTVNGRVFHDDPFAYADAGADAGSSSAEDLEVIARSNLLRNRRTNLQARA